MLKERPQKKAVEPISERSEAKLKPDVKTDLKGILKCVKDFSTVEVQTDSVAEIVVIEEPVEIPSVMALNEEEKEESSNYVLEQLSDNEQFEPRPTQGDSLVVMQERE